MQLVDWGFDHYQMGEIIKGLESGVDVSTYADPKCSLIQMSLIRSRLEDVSKKSQYDFYPAQEEIIRKGEEAGVDVTIFADRKFGDAQMRVIEDGLEKDLDVSIYADPKYDYEQMEEIKKKTGNRTRRLNLCGPKV